MYHPDALITSSLFTLMCLIKRLTDRTRRWQVLLNLFSMLLVNLTEFKNYSLGLQNIGTGCVIRYM